MRLIFVLLFKLRLGPAIMSAVLGMTSAYAADKVVIYTNWFAEPEHGGVWQAKAAGIFEKYGIDADVRQGGPQVNTSLNALIKQTAPNNTDEVITNALDEMRRNGIVVSGESLTLGIGAMTDTRWKEFFNSAVRAG